MSVGGVPPLLLEITVEMGATDLDA
jgi:hypothetical protein